jgi:hypothetical protein
MARCTFPEDDDGTHKRKRIFLDIAATPASLATAELRCIELLNAMQQGTYRFSFCTKPAQGIDSGRPA